MGWCGGSEDRRVDMVCWVIGRRVKKGSMGYMAGFWLSWLNGQEEKRGEGGVHPLLSAAPHLLPV